MVDNATGQTVTQTGGTDSVDLIKDNITISHYEGNNSIVNRGSVRKYSVYATDIDRSSNISSPSAIINFNLTVNGTNFITIGSNTTNSSGFADLYFAPNCSFDVGRQWWRAYTSNDLNYKDNVSSNFTSTVYGFLRPADNLPSNIKTYNTTQESIQFY